MDKKTFNPRDSLLAEESDSTYQPELVALKALITPSIKDQFIERYGRKSIENYSSDYLLATIDVPKSSIGFRFLASFGTHLKIVEPKAYRDDFRNYLTEMMDNYHPSPSMDAIEAP
jgi:predicted DNA-binding transcriptional regulator YafY